MATTTLTTDSTGKATATLSLVGAPNGFTITPTAAPQWYVLPAAQTTGPQAAGAAVTETFKFQAGTITITVVATDIASGATLASAQFSVAPS